MIFQKPCLVNLLPLTLTNKAFSSSLLIIAFLASCKYSCNAFWHIFPRGIVLSLAPFLQTTYPSPRLISSTFNEIISVTRIPVAYANSNIALSLVPFKSISFGCSNKSSTSFAVKTLGTLFSIFGD